MTTSRSPVDSSNQGAPVVEVHDWRELVTGQGAAPRRLSVRTRDWSCDLAPASRLVEALDRISLHSVTADRETGDLHVRTLDFWALEE